MEFPASLKRGAQDLEPKLMRDEKRQARIRPCTPPCETKAYEYYYQTPEEAERNLDSLICSFIELSDALDEAVLQIQVEQKEDEITLEHQYWCERSRNEANTSAATLLPVQDDDSAISAVEKPKKETLMQVARALVRQNKLLGFEALDNEYIEQKEYDVCEKELKNQPSNDFLSCFCKSESQNCVKVSEGVLLFDSSITTFPSQTLTPSDVNCDSICTGKPSMVEHAHQDFYSSDDRNNGNKTLRDLYYNYQESDDEAEESEYEYHHEVSSISSDHHEVSSISSDDDDDESGMLGQRFSSSLPVSSKQREEATAPSSQLCIDLIRGFLILISIYTYLTSILVSLLFFFSRVAYGSIDSTFGSSVTYLSFSMALSILLSKIIIITKVFPL